MNSKAVVSHRRRRALARRQIGAFEHLEARQLLAANPIITEFMADNDDNIGLGEIERGFGKPDPFGDGSTPDWIEIQNAGDESIDLQGYYLTDDVEELAKWSFPSVQLEPNGHLVVFASGTDTNNSADPLGNLHTNFKLRSGGEYLALVAPDGTTVVSDLTANRADYPQQVSNVSFGLALANEMVTPQSDAAYWVPTSGELDDTWMSPEFDALSNGFSLGNASLGLETRPTNRTNFAGQFQTILPDDTTSAYVRMDFEVSNSSDVSNLWLELQYDNGFIAYVNGVEVLRENAPENADWSSTAPSRSRNDSAALEFEVFDISESIPSLKNGDNVLAIHLLNHQTDTSDLLLNVNLKSDKPIDQASPGFLLHPTPGASNAFSSALTGPIISDVTENPGAISDDQDLVITAKLRQHNVQIATVTLEYRVMFEESVFATMLDNGTDGDRIAGDGIYSATIPASAAKPGEMLRWKVTAEDTQKRGMRQPIFAADDNSDEYFGTMVADPTVQSNLPVLNWFIDDTNLRSAGSSQGGRGSIFYLDQFYDNVGADDHGQSTRSFPKRSYDLDFNQGNRFEWQEGERPVRDVNLLTNWGDKAKFRHALAYEMYRDADSPALFAFPVRVERNGEFYSIADLVEDADDRTLERLGVNADGTLYKMYDGLTTSSQASWEKKTRRWEDNSELAELQQATRLRGEEWAAYAFENLDIPEFVNFLPLFDLQNNKGCCHKNYYFYQDTGLTNEWQIWIWDPDLAFGHDFKSGPGYFDDVMDWDNPLFSTRGTNNAVLRKLFQSSDTPGFMEMYLRRLRTLMDEQLQPSDTPYEERYLEQRIDAYVELMDPNIDPFDETPNPPEWPDARHGIVLGTDDADLDYNRWGSWDHGNGSRLHAARGETMREHTQRIKDEYLDQRRDFLYGLPQIPDAQIGNPPLDFGVIESEPNSGIANDEYIELTNPHDTAVDISAWRLAGGIELTFPAGTVIPSGWTLYVVADKNAFRSRSEGLFIVGGWEGELEPGEEVTLVGSDGALVRSVIVSSGQIVGDSNNDGLFNSTDLVKIFQAGKFEDGIPNNATFEEGDWNHDGDFNTRDLVLAFQMGHFVFAAGPTNLESVNAVDEFFLGESRSGSRRDFDTQSWDKELAESFA